MVISTQRGKTKKESFDVSQAWAWTDGPENARSLIEAHITILLYVHTLIHEYLTR